MKTPAARLTLIASMLAVACMMTVLALQAADDSEKTDKKPKKQTDDLVKYDKNGNGKLDPDEEAARKSDVYRQKGDKRKRKDDGK